MNQFIICYSGNKWYSLNIENENFNEDITLLSTDKYVTFQVSDFIRHLKAKSKKGIPEIVDFESLDKQFSQAGKDILGENKWHILKTLRRYEIIDEKYKIENIEDFLLKLKSLYEHILSNSNDELERFNEVEIKINKIIHRTQLQGIKIDFLLVEKRCETLDRYIYKLKNILQFDYNIFSPDERESQLAYVNSKNYKILDSLNNTITLLRKSDKVCKLFYELIRSKKDLKSLVFMLSQFGGKEYVHPYFSGFGTITSRITMKEPALQNLRKENRDIIIPEQDKELLYIDYSQFEAGILANMSKDYDLIKLYNDGDIYNDIAKKVLEKESDEESRKEAKILFYRYLYGDDFSRDTTGVGKKIITYFKQFPTLTAYKKDFIERCLKEGKVISKRGNHRVLIGHNENIWILSHHIQSIASYIFKKALLDVDKSVIGAKLLIPLHDGALYEVDRYKFEDVKEKIIKSFTENLQLVCESLNGAAEIKNFHALSSLRTNTVKS